MTRWSPLVALLALFAVRCSSPVPVVGTNDVGRDVARPDGGDAAAPDGSADAAPTDQPATDGPADASPDDAASDASPDDAASDASPDDAASDASPDATGDAAGCPAGQTLCGGACVDLSSDLAHCGGCGMACAPTGATGACVRGACTVSACAMGRADCNSMAADGCEVELNASAANCGACGRACTFPNATGACTAGSCGVGSCNTGFGDCDADPSNGCETDLRTAVGSCGMCGRGCTLANATAGCTAGACAVATCNAGFGNCDGMAANGCEAALNTRENCGACGMACGAGTRCSGGTCVSSCPMGTTFCMDSFICVNTSSDLANCGACGNACPTPTNGAPTCSAGACGVACSAGFADCDGMAANGCEANLNTSPTTCGACGRACSLPHATAGCAAGSCTVARCDAGFGDCDGNPANGCETNLNTTESACGACGSVCNVPNATAACAMGRCGVGSCNAGSADCDGMAANGCETPTTTNSNCGACGMACAAGTRCAGGSCVSSCPAGTTFCAASGVCADFQNDRNNCGMCGTVCPALANASPTCAMGTCGFTCNTGFADCDGMAANGCEANLGTSATACGACGRACRPPNATGACTTGLCTVVACQPGWGDCNGDPSDGCEVDLLTTVSACGTCVGACRPPNATGACAAGRCGIATCDAGFGNCDGNSANGCETPLSSNTHCGACGMACAAGTVCSGGTCVASCAAPTTFCAASMNCLDLSGNVTNCGACGRTCPVPANASATCAMSTCGISCTGSFANCDGSAANGCEVDLNASAANCGACGRACALPNAAPTCSGGTCAVATCNAGFGDCDGASSNGCEVNLNTTPSQCGACGAACVYPNAAATCTGGSCGLGACNAGFGNCNGRADDGCETALVTSNNCGACGNRCTMGQVCAGGVCASACVAGTTFCAATGACVNLQTNPNNCGSCGNICPSFPNVIRTCMSGTCGGTCAAGWGNCDMNTGNGCETNVLSSTTHCGACGNRCAFANATAACASGTCAIATCNPGFANCNGSLADGCEVNLLTSNSSCGSCGRACTMGTTCRLGSCR